jgi:dihydropteroate synthase
MRPLVLGVLNVTPDSFSDGGRYLDRGAAVARAEEMLSEGADLIDVGGESTRPGARPVDPDVERQRVVPVVRALAGRCRVSVDTRHRSVAEAAVDAGASLINDVSATLYPVAAATGAGWLVMHMKGEPATMQRRPEYRDVVGEVLAFLVERAGMAEEAGVGEVWIDPGFGFGKTLDHNLALLAAIDRFVASGYPVAIGTSRKGLCGALLAESDGADEPVPLDDRLEASVATATWAMLNGVRMIRVHDVKAGWQAATVVAGQRDAVPGGRR